MSEWQQKRFWAEVTVAEAAGGFEVLLDARPLRTPLKLPLRLPTAALAEAIAEEWRNQEDRIDPGTMPLTRLANSSLDKVVPQFDDVAEIVAAYGETDLICYRADAPQALVARQSEVWDPYVEWARDTLGVQLAVTSGVLPVAQPAASLERFAAIVADRTAFELAALHELVSLTGSLVLGLAADATSRELHKIWDDSRIDEIWQIEQWGADEEAEAVTALKKKAFLEAGLFLSLARSLG